LKQSLLELARNLGMSPARRWNLPSRSTTGPAQPEIERLCPRRCSRAPTIFRSPASARDWSSSSAPTAPAPIPSSASTATSARLAAASAACKTTGLIQGQIDFTVFDRDRNGEAQELASRVKRIDDQIADLRRGIEEDIARRCLNLDPQPSR
jgi:hypothetical protein